MNRICINLEDLKRLIDEESYNKILKYIRSRRRGRPKIDVSKTQLKRLLTRYYGNKRAVARTLGISPSTLYKLLKKYSLMQDN